MSYILDALKRAETEKVTRILPTQQSEMGETPRNTYAPKITRRVMIECILVLVVLTAVGVYFATTHEAPTNPSLKSTTIVSVSPSPKQPQASKTPAQPLPAPTTLAPPLKTEPPKDGEKQEASQQPKKEPEIPQLIEMPESFQQSIPALQFKGHFYSTDPQKGGVIIGDKTYPVGAEIAPSIILEEVTPTGVILNTRNTRFRIEVLGNWVY